MLSVLVDNWGDRDRIGEKHSIINRCSGGIKMVGEDAKVISRR